MALYGFSKKPAFRRFDFHHPKSGAFMETRECTYDQAKAHAQRNGLEFRPHNGMMLTNEEFQKQAETQMIFGGYAYGKF